MLDGVHNRRATEARHVLFAAAGGLEWLYRATKNNPYTAHIDAVARKRSEEAEKELAKQQQQDQVARDERAKVKQQQDGIKTNNDTDQEIAEQDNTDLSQNNSNNTNVDSSDSSQKPDTSDKPDENDQEVVEKQKQDIADLAAKKWPWKEVGLHHAVATMPRSVETSIKSVARYLAQQEKDPVLRIKALHDYVADRVAYDTVALYSGNFPDQGAQNVFKTRKGVCAGYANLLAALASAMNEKIVVVTGNARDRTNPGQFNQGNGHAWNAARIGGRWYLIDSCWDAGYVSPEKGFTKSYGCDYLLPPPTVMIADHFPDEKTWQLLATPLSQGEFLRRPMLRPSFQSADLTLVSPQRAQNETGTKAAVVLKNPDKKWLTTSLEQNGREIENASDYTNSEVAHLERTLPGKGVYRLNMFANQRQYGPYDFVGAIDFVSR